MKKIIITGAPRTGTTALATLLSYPKNILVMNELAIFDNNPENYYTRKDDWINKPDNQNFLKLKGFTEQDIDRFFVNDFRDAGDLEFFGDKWPTYCTSRAYCEHLVKNHSDAYFIFTYRNPCAVMNSNIKRTKLSPGTTGDWVFKDLKQNTDKLTKYNTLWSSEIFPFVENRLIVNYDYYINNVQLLIQDLNKFLNTTIDIPDLENTPGHMEIFDKEFRGLYVHPNPEEYKDTLTVEEINYIKEKTKLIDQYIGSLDKFNRF